MYIISLNTYLPTQRCPTGGSRSVINLDNYGLHPIRRGRNDDGGHLPDDRGHHPNWRVTAAIPQPQPIYSSNQTQHGQNARTASKKPPSHLGFLRCGICKMKVHCIIIIIMLSVAKRQRLLPSLDCCSPFVSLL